MAPPMPESAIIRQMTPETVTISELDTRIIRCLQLSPRIPFRTVGDILGTSEQTVARRYRALERSGLIRVTAVVRPMALGQSNWMVRVQCRPSGAESLAQALAQRDDVSWVTLVSGGAEIVCVLRSRTSQARDDLLMKRLPRTAPVLAMSASMVLHRFVAADAAPAGDWTGLADRLTEQQTAAVLATSDFTTPAEDTHFDLQPGDLQLLAALAEDGRAPTARLATATGMSEGRVTRRLRALFEGGAAFFDVDLSVAALGLHTTAQLWLTVTPAELHRAGVALGAAQEIAFAGAITGPQNLTAVVLCRDVPALYRFVTEKIGAIAGVQSLEICPTLRTVKQAGALTDGSRLLVP